MLIAKIFLIIIFFNPWSVVHYLILIPHPVNVWCLPAASFMQKTEEPQQVQKKTTTSVCCSFFWSHLMCTLYNYKNVYTPVKSQNESFMCHIYPGCGRLGFVQNLLRLSHSVSWDPLQPSCGSACFKQVYIMDGWLDRWKFNLVGLTQAVMAFSWNMIILLLIL